MSDNKKIKACSFCGSKIPYIPCDECGTLVEASELTNCGSQGSFVTQKLCNHCRRIKFGHHTYAHNLKVYKTLNLREQLQYCWDNPTFAYLYIKQLLAQS